MPHPYAIYDVFTDTPLAGNPLAVVFEADDLDAARMQAIAGEFNLSETIFMMAPTDAAHTASARIFTPKHELAFAGHPSVGGTVALAERQGLDRVALELPAGVVRADLNGGRASFAAPKLPTLADGAAAPSILAKLLGLTEAEIGGEFEPVRAASGGPSFTVVPLRSAEALARVSLSLDGWDEGLGAEWAAIYAVAPGDPSAPGAPDHRCRMFAPTLGIVEDPATGSAGVAFMAVLAGAGRLAQGRNSIAILQGAEMGRPSHLRLGPEMVGETLRSVALSGQAVPVAEGTLFV